jgi:hypothetical protein
MAELDRRLNRESWLKWAIEFMRHGLWLGPEITVHGPHEPPDNLMWGEAEASIDGVKDSQGTCVFRTARGVRKYHPSHVRIMDGDRHGDIFPLKKESELTPKAQRWLRVARQHVEEGN